MTEGIAREREGRSQDSVNEEYCDWLETLIEHVRGGGYRFADWDYSEKTIGGYDNLARRYVDIDEAEFLTTVELKFRLISTDKA